MEYSPATRPEALPIPSPISWLPVELLIDIFTYCTFCGAIVPLTLASVCRAWKAVVHATPQIWQLLSLHDTERSASASHTQAQLWLARSAPLPFDVTLVYTNVDMLLPLLSPIFPSSGRWRYLTLTCRDEDHTFGIARMSQLYGPLARLTLRKMSTDPISYNDVQFHLWGALEMQLRVTSLPQPPLVLPLRFTSIAIDEEFLEGHDDIVPHQFLGLLEVCPEQQSLTYRQSSRETELADERLPIVRLPHLRTLRLRRTWARVILSHLDAPALTHLYLEHLNVEIELDTVFSEDGDSDDEAHDFSQSPYSDHCTGMGLRSLIDRSNPPLQVLDMDYSDMRTKDFRWCFDRLKVLQRFRIVGSDMSNTVINLLRPFRVETEREVEGGSRVRLPCLEELELWNCQQVSGDAIVASLTERDLATRAGAVDAARLVRVTVIGCGNFTQEHAHGLSKVLGSRFCQ
jgi:hypothetical protein